MGVLEELGIQEGDVEALARDEPTPPPRPASRPQSARVRVSFDHVEELARLGHHRAAQLQGLLRFARAQARRHDLERRRERLSPDDVREALRTDDAEIDALAEEFAYAAGSERGWGR